MNSKQENSRKNKRKEARQARNQLKFQSWCNDQRERRTRKEQVEKRKVENGERRQAGQLSEGVSEQNLGDWVRRKRLYETCSVVGDGGGEMSAGKKRGRGKLVSGLEKVKKGGKGNGKTKFEEYLQMDMKADDRLALEDLEMERRLARRLKVKGGKLDGVDDGFNVLFKGLKSLVDSVDGEVEDRGAREKQDSVEGFSQDEGDADSVDEELHETSDADVEGDRVVDATEKKRQTKKRKSKKEKKSCLADDDISSSPVQEETHSEEDGSQGNSTNVVGSSSREKYIAPRLRSDAGNESGEHIQISSRLSALLNKLSEFNVESITGDIAAIFQSVSRSVGTQIISDRVLSAARYYEQNAAAFAAFVAGMACSVGMDLSAKFIASLAKCFQDEYHKENKVSVENLTLLLSYLYIFGVCSSDLIYDFLTVLSEQLTEIDVYAILKVLNCCGMKIRADDPAAMKNFILAVQNRVNELKKSRGEERANAKASSQMELMLHTILDIKNNKKRPKEDSAQHTRIKKWLQKSQVENIVLRGLNWSKLLDPEKKGQWWLSVDVDSKTDDVEEVANTIDMEALEAQKLLQLAASQRMNTGARKAIFCIIMSAEDYLDAYEKLLRLDLQGTQDRDIIRVLVECCLQEKVFNKYYMALANHLCEHEKNHKFTLQYCIWDHFKELDSMQLLRLMHLARFIAEMVASFTLSLAVLKSVELSDAGQPTAKRIVHFRMLFEFLLEKPDTVVWNVFTRVAIAPDLEALRHGIEFFIREWVVPSNKAMTSKYKVVKKALSNSLGVLM